MDILQMLKDNGLTFINDKTVMYADVCINYIEAFYKYEEKLFARYIIFDLLERNTNSEIIEEVCMRDFYGLQTTILRDIYFNMLGDTRFNLYLVFLVDDNNMLLRNIPIQQDFYFARKLVLKKNEIENYFTRRMFLRYQVDTRKWYLDEKSEKEFLMQRFYSIKNLIMDSIPILNNIKRRERKEKTDELLNINGELKEFPNKYMTDIEVKKENRYRKGLFNGQFKVQKIQSVEIEDFRCFRDAFAINFRKVNLIYGENGTGKTSLLEALELAMTGEIRNGNQKKEESTILLKCKDSRGKIKELNSQNINIRQAELWYGRKVNSLKEFNKLFNKYNYFDTRGAYFFASEDKEQINIQQMRHFLGIESLFGLIDMKKEMISICDEMIKFLGKLKIKTTTEQTNVLRKKARSNDVNQVIKKFEQEREKLRNDGMGNIREELMNTYIVKIEEMFKILTCTYEYSGLEIDETELVGIRSIDGDKVSMSKMSTGQKVCLALSLMFALFISNENSPNIIMLDEPTANLDDIHMLNLLDVLRKFAINNTQIFFTTANPDVAKLFRRKFSFLGNEFGYYRISETQNRMKVVQKVYNMETEEPIRETMLI